MPPVVDGRWSRGDTPRVEDDHDRLLRLAAFDRARELSRRYTDLVPLDVLKEGFTFDGRRISFGSFYSGIFRGQGATRTLGAGARDRAPEVGKACPV